MSLPDDEELPEYIPELPDCDMEPEEVEALEVHYLECAEPLVSISGPLVGHETPYNTGGIHGLLMTRKEAYIWARKKYGKHLHEMAWHPHRWVARVKESYFNGR